MDSLLDILTYLDVCPGPEVNIMGDETIGLRVPIWLIVAELELSDRLLLVLPTAYRHQFSPGFGIYTKWCESCENAE